MSDQKAAERSPSVHSKQLKTKPSGTGTEMPEGNLADKIFLWALLLVPIAILLEFIDTPSIVKFFVASLAIVPLARLLGQATEELSAKTGAGLGAFLNASFGNAAELIIGFFALREGLYDVVKASLTGAIIGNVLLVMGFAFLAGGLKREKQSFNRTAAGMNATLLLLASIGLLAPALFHITTGGKAVGHEADLSLEIAAVLALTYLVSLLFSLKTHRHLYLGESNAREAVPGASWPVGKSIAILIACGACIGLISELLVASVEPAAAALGMNQVFIGVIFVAIVGNAAEHSTAITTALKDKLDISLGIALGSSQQVALFVAPLLVFIGRLIGRPMDLLFTPLEVMGVTLSAVATGFVASDGESNWMEGVLLIAVYLILAIAFYALPQ